MKPLHLNALARLSRCSWMVWLIAAFAWLAAGHTASGALATNQIVQYSSRAWQMDEGLPQNGVQAIAQTHDGYLWVGTVHGLTRFDGVRFIIFDAQNTPAFRSSNIGALCETTDGSLWIATLGGLIEYRNGQFTPHTLSDNDQGNNIKDLVQTKDGSLWVATLDGLYRRKNGRWDHFMPKDGLTDTVTRCLAATDTRLWIGTRTGLGLRENGVFTNQPALSDKFVRTVLEDHNGNVWVGWWGGLARIADGKVKLYGKEDGLTDNNVTTLFEDRRGEIWVGTYGGLSRWADGNFIAEKDSQGNYFDQINAIFEDVEGNIWVGTRDGLQELRLKRFQAFTRQQGLSHNNIMCVLEDRHDAIWVGTWGGGLSRIKNDQITNYTWENDASNGLTSDLILSLLEDRDGSMLIGTDYEGGTFRKAGEKFSRVWDQKQTPQDRVIRVIYRDHENRLWFGGPGLILWNTNEHFLEGKIIRSILEAHDGTLWIGTSEGLFYRKDGQFYNWTREHDLLHDYILSLYEDANNDLWVGTGGIGLYRYHQGKMRAYTSTAGMFGDDIFEILEDDNGWFWLSCSRGIFRVSRKNLDAFDQGKTETIRSIVYGKADGMESIQCNGVSKPSAWKAHDGRLWFATTKGLVVTDPSLNLGANDRPPPVMIEEVIAEQRPFELPSQSGGTVPARSLNLTLPPGRGDLEIHYTALSFDAPEKNRFKYKLEGIDADWVEVTRRVAYYNNLRPGQYTFRVMACNNDGVWNRGGATVSVILLPHFWQTWWFRGSLAFLLAAIAVSIVRYITTRNMQQELQRLEKQHAVEAERIRIARDMHDEIGAKLTKISFLGALAKRKISHPEEAGTQIDKMSQTARDVIRALDEIVWAVNPANDSLEDLATYVCRNATEFFDNSPMVCQFDIPDELPVRRLGTDLRHNLLMAVKEALNNVLKHSGATNVHVQISVEEEFFTVKISDNGSGFEPGAKATGAGNGVASTGPRVGNGLLNMQHRLEAIGGRCEVISHAGQGTTIVFTVYYKGRTGKNMTGRNMKIEKTTA